MKRMLLLFAVAGVLLPAGCVIVNRVTERTTDHQLAGARVRQFKCITKAHLSDGSLVVFPKGFKVDLGQLVGDGLRYDMARRPVGPVAAVAADSVVSMQHYPRRWDWDASLVSLPYAALLATPVVALIALSASSFSFSFDLHPPGTTTCYQPLPLLSLYAPLRDSILRSRESTADGTARTTGRSLAGEEK